MEKKYFLIFIGFLFLIPIISAFSWGGGYYGSPLDLLDNEWARFTIVFILFFAIIFYTTNKSFHHAGVSAAIALALSLLITMTIERRGMLYGYVGDEIGTYLLVIAFLIGIGFLIKFGFEFLGTIGALAAVIAVWLFLYNADPYEFFPYELQTDTLLGIYNIIASIPGLIVLIILTIAIAQNFTQTAGDAILKNVKKLFKK